MVDLAHINGADAIKNQRHILDKEMIPEEAKKIRLEQEHQFEIWKKEIIEEYIENYPHDFKWQLEFDDWKGMMDELTHIYKEKRV